MKKNTGGPAFPAMVADPSGYGEGFFTGEAPNGSRQFLNTFPGMTLRDWFAGQALKGLMSNSGGPIQANGVSGWGYVNCTPEQVAEICGKQADAMLAERSKE